MPGNILGPNDYGRYWSFYKELHENLLSCKSRMQNRKEIEVSNTFQRTLFAKKYFQIVVLNFHKSRKLREGRCTNHESTAIII